jgi:hypothetical protein
MRMMDAMTTLRCVVVGPLMSPRPATRALNIVVRSTERSTKGTRPIRSLEKMAIRQAMRPQRVTMMLYVKVFAPRPMLW